MDAITAGDTVRALRAVCDAVESDKAGLSRLDGATGHGAGVALGVGVAALAATPPADVFTAAARSFLDAVGAPTGPRCATAFLRAGAAAKGHVDPGAASAALILEVLAANL